ncbi:MAG: flagellar basal body L-ring protein FlgH, partial [Deltaproteobacteria bacterium]
APMPPKFIYTDEQGAVKAAEEGSLWSQRASLFEDRKARRVNDLVTILVTESTKAEKTATTDAERDSSADFGVDEAFGLPLDLGFKWKDGHPFIPSAKGSAKSTLKGKGTTTREGSVVATITAKVVEVLPNDNLVIEGRKEVLVNNEKDILVVKGIIRPDDISDKNTVYSEQVADAQIFLVGKGVIDDKQSSGWLVRFLDKVWPF